MIYIKPFHHIDRLSSVDKTDYSNEEFYNGRYPIHFFNGKSAIHFLIISLRLKRDDEVCIFTSTDSSYVSTCVSATIFNYCKISRVLTDQTKLIYVVHEFGLPHPDIRTLALEAKNRGIPLVEDCAHSMDSIIDEIRIGMFGDFAIYSLSKHLPLENGGLLLSKEPMSLDNKYYSMEINNRVRDELGLYIPFLNAMSERKRRNFSKINEVFENSSLFVLNDGVVPHLYVADVKNAIDLFDSTSKFIEPHPIHVSGRFAVSVQPLMEEKEIAKLLTIIKENI